MLSFHEGGRQSSRNLWREKQTDAKSVQPLSKLPTDRYKLCTSYGYLSGDTKKMQKDAFK